MFLHTYAFTNVVYSRILTIDVYNRHTSKIWLFTQTCLNLIADAPVRAYCRHM
jgi:hypothetical protein